MAHIFEKHRQCGDRQLQAESHRRLDDHKKWHHDVTCRQGAMMKDSDDGHDEHDRHAEFN